MSSILEYPPTLNYIGAIDTSSSTSGQTMYSVLLDQLIPGLGNILMFEYKYIATGAEVEPTTVNLGYVSIENAINSGISNQWSIAIPAPNNIYDPIPAVKVAVRAYVGLTDTNTSEIGVTEWSNELTMYVPPPQQNIYSAYYDANSYAQGNDDLYVFLQPNDNINYNVVKFVAAFYYKNTSGTTVWDVSEPRSASLVTLGDAELRMVHIPDFGIVSDTDQHVYVAVYATYSYQYLNNTYFSVSEVSETEDATPATNYLSPRIDSINYSVYTNPSTQTMTVNWSPPASAGIPTYTVASYILYISTDNVVWSEVRAGILATTLSYSVDVSSYACGTKLYYQVVAISTAGTLSPASLTTDLSQLNMFRYASAPQNLKAFDIVQNYQNLGMTIEFDTPGTDGCGVPLRFVIIVDGVEITTTPYVPEQYGYSIELSNLPYSQSGTIEVYLITRDTNPTEQGGDNYADQSGASANVGYFAANLVLQEIVYDVYNYGNDDQQMHLVWNNPVSDIVGWFVSQYDIYLTITGNDPASKTLINTMNVNNLSLSYIFDAAFISCGNNLTFEVVATVTDGATVYQINSNDASINKFLFATVPQNAQVMWSIASTDNSKMDIRGRFSNPSSTGCGAIVRFVVNILDATGQTVISTQYVTYDPMNMPSTGYTVNFNDITYSATGTMQVYLETTDTNSSTIMNGSAQMPSYTSDNLPIFRYATMSPDRMTFVFEILTHTELKPYALALYAESLPNALTSINWLTNDDSTGVDVDQETLDNGELRYTVRMTPAIINAEVFPAIYSVAVANDVGISDQNAPVPQP